MTMLAFIPTAFLDPVQAAIVLAVICFYRGPATHHRGGGDHHRLVRDAHQPRHRGLYVG